MAFESEHRRIVASLVFVFTVVLVWFGNGLRPLWPLMWFAPLPILIFALRSSWRSAALIAFLSWLVGCLNSWRYFQVLHAPFSAWLAVFSISATRTQCELG